MRESDMNSIRSIFDGVISRGGYDLTGMLARVDEYHVAGRLTDEERDALYQEARAHAQPVYDVQAEIEALWAAVRALQTQPSEPDEPADEWPEFAQPTGAHDAYHAGDQIAYNGKHYICKMDGCVWTPDAYPAGWEVQA